MLQESYRASPAKGFYLAKSSGGKRLIGLLLKLNRRRPSKIATSAIDLIADLSQGDRQSNHRRLD